MTSSLDMDSPLIIDDTFLNKKGLCGLRNLGNTCFMNSIIQCLNNTQPFMRYILSNKFKKDLNEEKEDYLVIEQWNEMSRSLWHKNAVFTPVGFLKCIQKLANTKGYGEFTGFRQNDSQEFLQFFLECAHNALSKEVNMNIKGTARNDYDKLAIKAYESFATFFKNDYSEIVKTFYGQFYTRVKKLTKDNEENSSSFEPFNSLSLEIINKSGKSRLEDCLDNFTLEETIECDNESSFIKEVKFWSLPDVLIVFFKRFNNSLTKKDDLVEFPLENLDMSKYVCGYNKSKYKYDLYAVSNHGGGLAGGHYWAYCKNNDGNWYKFNDAVVSTLKKDKVVSNNAYCLFYKKQ